MLTGRALAHHVVKLHPQLVHGVPCSVDAAAEFAVSWETTLLQTAAHQAEEADRRGMPFV
jgi:hypothetical protein